MSFDDILEKRIGFGSYQKCTYNKIGLFFYLALIDLIDGMELVLMSTLSPILKQEL